MAHKGQFVLEALGKPMHEWVKVKDHYRLWSKWAEFIYTPKTKRLEWIYEEGGVKDGIGCDLRLITTKLVVEDILHMLAEREEKNKKGSEK